MKGWHTSASDCTGNQIVVWYEFVSSESFKCRQCNRSMQRRGGRRLKVTDTPYMQYDIALQIEVYSAVFGDVIRGESRQFIEQVCGEGTGEGGFRGGALTG